MPWKPLCPQTKRTAKRLARKRRQMREDCFRHRRREVAGHLKLSFWQRIKFYLLIDKS